jgi:catechol 2,3-dioxygenase-like lactoylglutathione lyase family enzyme
VLWGCHRPVITTYLKEDMMAKEFEGIRFDHVHIKCHDSGKTEKFYQEMFGARTVERYVIRDTQSIMMELGETFIILTNSEKAERLESAEKPRESPTIRYGLGHFGVRVRNLDEAAKTLKEKGAEFLWEPRDSKGGKIRVAFIRGPEDDVIEIVQRND